MDAFALICAVVRVATPDANESPPAVPTTGTVPSAVAPAKKVTFPVGATPRLCVLMLTDSVKLVFGATLVGKVTIEGNVVAFVIVSGALMEELEL